MRGWAFGAGVRLTGLVAAFSAGDVGNGQQGQQVAQLRGVEHIRRGKAQDVRAAVLDDIYGAGWTGPERGRQTHERGKTASGDRPQPGVRLRTAGPLGQFAAQSIAQRPNRPRG